MPTPKLTDELAQQAADAFRAHGKKHLAAEALGLPWGTFNSRLNIASERGMCGTRPVMPGFAIKSVASKDGDAWIKQTREHGEQFEVLAGHSVRAVSALVDADGRIVQQWLKTADGRDAIDWATQIAKAFKDYEPKGYPLSAPERTSGRLLTLTPLADWHIGLRAWAGETGTNWDLAIAERVIGDAIDDLVSRSPASKHAVVLGGGDLLHSDNNENKTARSGNVLDVDGRHDKCLDVAERLVARTIDAHLLRHEHVTVRILKGNHDEHSSVAIAHFLKGHYRNEPRVTVDTDASLFFWRRFGRVLIGATHGHEAKIKDMPAIMAHRRAEDWGVTKHRYIHGFHLHHSAKYATEGGGCISEVHQTPTPQDAWHYGSGFLSGRSLQSITYDAFLGEVGRVRVAVLDAATDNEPMQVAA